MHIRTTLRLALALVALAVPAFAQTPPPTRAGDAHEARVAKASTRTPFAPGTVERVLTMIESGGFFQRALAGRDGLGVRIGGIESGAGIALGPSFRATTLFDGSLQLHASGAASIRMDRELEAGLALPHLAPRLAVAVDATSTHLAQERFFGAGMGSALSDETAFSLDTTRVTARATFAAARWLRMSAEAGTVGTSAADAAARVPAISTRFTDRDAPALSAGAGFTVFSFAATADYRDVPQNPRRGGMYRLGLERYAAARRNSHSFTRIDAEAEQHLSAWKRQRLLTLRAVASASIADRGHEVPFYLQPTLGGSGRLRGFVADRFRDDNLLLLQAEYGFDVSPFLNAVVFYEAGAVAPRWRDLTAGSLRRDYGIGFRFGSARTVAFRTDVALGSGEGTRLTMRFNHAF